MSRLKIPPSLFEPLEVEIGAKVYRVRPLNQTVWDNIAKINTAAVSDGDMSPLYEQVLSMIDAPRKEIYALDIRIIREIIRYVTDEIVGKNTSAEKKEPRTEETP